MVKLFSIFTSKQDPGALDTALNAASALDWITPLTGVMQDIANPGGGFAVSARAGWNTRDVKRTLKAAGVKGWGFQYDNSGDQIIFGVGKKQAKKALQALRDAGAPVTMAPWAARR